MWAMLFQNAGGFESGGVGTSTYRRREFLFWRFKNLKERSFQFWGFGYRWSWTFINNDNDLATVQTTRTLDALHKERKKPCFSRTLTDTDNGYVFHMCKDPDADTVSYIYDIVKCTVLHSLRILPAWLKRL